MHSAPEQFPLSSIIQVAIYLMIFCSGDNRTGEGGGDDETIGVRLAKLDASVAYVCFNVSAYNRYVLFG